MKLSEVLYENKPTVDLAKLDTPFDPDLLGAMMDDHEAKIFIKHWDLDDVFSDARRQIADDGMAREQSELNVTKDSEVEDIDGKFAQVWYSLSTHKIFVECDFRVHVVEQDYENRRPKNKGEFWMNDDYMIEVTDSTVEVKIELLEKRPAKSADWVDITKFYEETYAND